MFFSTDLRFWLSSSAARSLRFTSVQYTVIFLPHFLNSSTFICCRALISTLRIQRIYLTFQCSGNSKGSSNNLQQKYLALSRVIHVVAFSRSSGPLISRRENNNNIERSLTCNCWLLFSGNSWGCSRTPLPVNFLLETTACGYLDSVVWCWMVSCLAESILDSAINIKRLE